MSKLEGISRYLKVEAELDIDLPANTVKNKYDIDKIVKNSHRKIFADASSEFFSAVASYKALTLLHAQLNPEKNISLSKKLENFKTVYNRPSLKEVILNNNDNVVIKFFREIHYLLAKIFSSLECYLTPQQKLRSQLRKLQHDEEDSAPRSGVTPS